MNLTSSPKTTDPTHQALLDRIAQLEARLSALESRLDLELPEVPWHVIAAAVAAILPDAKITAINRAADTLTMSPLNFWAMGGRLEHFESHRLR